jgi:deoxyribodipyrimidine photolyase-related protein
VLFLSAMRHFAARLASQGMNVRYVRLDDPENTGTFEGEVRRALGVTGCHSVCVTEAGEWRLAEAMRHWSARFDVPVSIIEDDRFLCSHARFKAWASGRRTLRMEHFYREMRRDTGLLFTTEGTPEGGQWNFDADNRRRYDGGRPLPPPHAFEPDAITQEVLALVGERFPARFGSLAAFDWPVTHRDAEEALEAFLLHALPGFGDYQDAMLAGEPLLFHSRLSAALNIGLLEPLAVCRAAESAWRAGRAPLNAVEGFIRQIIGWREFIRGVYWLCMPEYRTRNALGARRRLPDFYWGAPTSMRCVAEVVGETRRGAYAHHIQRLMVTGNFALLAGIRPEEVSEWYLAVYADAIEWVELPNVLGMALHADGGFLASKPYCASGAYIDRMSDYCRGCSHDRRKRSGDSACPFNVLYWDFLMRHEGRLGRNPRMAMSYRTLACIPADERAAIRASAQTFLDAVAPEC